MLFCFRKQRRAAVKVRGEEEYLQTILKAKGKEARTRKSISALIRCPFANYTKQSFLLFTIYRKLF